MPLLKETQSLNQRRWFKRWVCSSIWGWNTTTFCRSKVVYFTGWPIGKHKKAFYCISTQIARKACDFQGVQKTVFNDVKFLWQHFIENYQQFITFHVEQSGYVLEDNEELDKLLDNIGPEHQLLNDCKDFLGLIEPVKV